MVHGWPHHQAVGLAGLRILELDPLAGDRVLDLVQPKRVEPVETFGQVFQA